MNWSLVVFVLITLTLAEGSIVLVDRRDDAVARQSAQSTARASKGRLRAIGERTIDDGANNAASRVAAAVLMIMRNL
jgi:hypothetical protein